MKTLIRPVNLDVSEALDQAATIRTLVDVGEWERQGATLLFIVHTRSSPFMNSRSLQNDQFVLYGFHLPGSGALDPVSATIVTGRGIDCVHEALDHLNPMIGGIARIAFPYEGCPATTICVYAIVPTDPKVN